MLGVEVAQRLKKSDSKRARFLRDTIKLLELPKMYLNAPVFVASLSEKKDLLSQWRGYCHRGEGFSVGFGNAALDAPLSHPQVTIAKCIYDETKQRNLISTFLDEAIDDHLDDYEPQEDLNANFKVLRPSFLDRFFRIAALIKHHTFSEEQEWRLVYWERALASASDITDLKIPGWPRNLRVLHRPRGSLLIPYVRLPLVDTEKRRAELPEIVAGPSMQPDLVLASLTSFLKSSASYYSEDGLEELGKPKLSVREVRNSDIPLRAI